jgi:hypothetical protein
MVVERSNGRFIERMASRLIAKDCGGEVTALLEDQVRVDSAVTYDESINIESIGQGASTLVTTEVPHGLSSGDIVVLSCAGDFDGRYEVEENFIADNAFIVLEGEGTNNTATFIDSSTFAHAFSVQFFAPIINNSESKFNSSSIYFPRIGLSSGEFESIFCSGNDCFNLNSDKTLELFVWYDETTHTASNHTQYYGYGMGFSGGSAGYRFFSDAGTTEGIKFIYGMKPVVGSEELIEADNVVLTNNSWNHIAVVISGTTGNTVKIFVNGKLQVTGNLSGSRPTLNSGATNFIIGSTLSGVRLDSYIGTNYVKYTTDFTPPTAPWASSALSFLIVHATLGTPIDSSAYTAFTKNGYARLAADTFSGLDHLEGETVSILADGKVQEQQIVVGGEVTIPSSSGLVHVGLPYYSELETLDITYATENGTTVGVQLKVGNMLMRFVDTAGGFLGPDSDNLYEALTHLRISHAASELLFTPDDYDWTEQSISDPDPYLFSGDLRLPLGAGWRRGGRMFYQQRDPLPVTITSVLPEVTDGGAV